MEGLRNALSISNQNVLKTLKDLIQTHRWIQNEDICEAVKGPLLRLCGRYLFIEKRRGFALNPVGMFSFSVKAYLVCFFAQDTRIYFHSNNDVFKINTQFTTSLLFMYTCVFSKIQNHPIIINDQFKKRYYVNKN